MASPTIRSFASLVLTSLVAACSAHDGSSLAEDGSEPGESVSTEGDQTATLTLSVSTILPKADATVSGTIGFDAAASSADGIASVDFMVDGNVVGRAKPTVYGYIFNWNSNGATDGAHSVRALAKDLKGGSRQSAPINFFVSNHPAQDPNVSWIAPKQSEVLSGRSTIDVTIADDKGVGGVKARLLLDGADVGLLEPTIYGWLYKANDGTYGLNTAAYAQTIHTLQVVATDADGNRGYSSVIGVGFQQSSKERRGETMGIVSDITEANMDRAKALGLKWVRIAYEWHWMSSAPGQINWAGYDKEVAIAKSRGMKIIACAMGAPSWANGGHTDSGHYPPTSAHMGDFADYAAGLASHGADVVEVWNEPNSLYSFFRPAPDVNIWANIVKAVYPKVKAVKPSALVITGGMAAYGDLNNTSDTNVKKIAPVNYFKAAMAIPGFKDSFDGVGHHPYIFPEDPISSPIGWNGLMQTKMLQDVLNLYGVGNRSFWFTEYGNTTLTSDPLGMTEAQSAYHYQRYLDGFALLRGAGIKIGAALSYTMYDGTKGTGNTWEEYMGIFHANGTEKPSAAIIRKAAGELW